MSHRHHIRRGLLVPGFLVLLALALPRPLIGQVKARQARPAEPLGSPGDERRIPERLRHRDRAAVQRISVRLRGGAPFEEVRGQWVALVRNSRPEDVGALVQWVMRDAFGEKVAAERRMAEGRGDAPARYGTRNKQQQTLQTISSVSKSMHDTAKASIQNQTMPSTVSGMAGARASPSPLAA